MSALAQSAFAAALLDPALPCPTGLRAWNGSDPKARLAVYRNNVVSSLIDALADNFPVVLALVGEEFFRAMSGVFVRRHPPRSRLLAFYGEEFADFIECFDPAQSLPYLADVARLEMARVKAYHAADAPALAPEAVQAALSHTEQLPWLRFRLHPSVQALESRHAMVSIWAAHQLDGEVELGDCERPEQALVMRSGLELVVVPLGAGGARFCAALGQGMPLGEAGGRVMQEQPSFDLQSALGALFLHGAVCAID